LITKNKVSRKPKTNKGSIGQDVNYKYFNIVEKSNYINLVEESKKLFYWRPNTKINMTENITFNTDKIEAINGNEQRISLLQEARNTFKYYYTLHTTELQKFNNFLFQYQSSFINLPLWQEIGRLRNDIEINQTVFKVTMDFRRYQTDIKFIIMNPLDYSDYSIFFIDGIDYDNEEIYVAAGFDRAWGEGALIMPVVSVKVKDAINKTLPAGVDRLAGMSISFQKEVGNDTIINNSIIQYPKYKDLYILDKQPNRRDILTQQWQRKKLSIDLGFGKPHELDRSDQPFNLYNYTWTLTSREKINDLKTFFAEMRGSASDFWMPTFENDMTSISNSYSLNDNYLLINDINLMETFLGRKLNIKINLTDGSYLIREVVNVNEGAGIEQVFLDKIHGVDFTDKQIGSINFVYKSRFNNDDFAFIYTNDEQAEITKNVFMQNMGD